MATGADHVTDEQNGALATASAVALPEGSVPEWVKLFDYGTIRGRDGRGPYILRDLAHAQQVVANTTAYQQGADLPIDYEHQSQMTAKNGQPAPAAGWIKAVEARSDGIFARVDWTQPAATRIEAKEYRYISPTFAGDGPASTGNVVRIAGAGLTNLPNFTIPAIASQQTEIKAMTPEELLAQIRAACGLPADAIAEAVTTHCQQLRVGVNAVAKLLGLPETTAPGQLATAAQAALATLATALKVTGDVDLPKLATAAQQIGAAPAQIDLTKYVPMPVHLAVASQLTVLQGQTATTEADRAVDDAVKAGKVTPALKDWALAMASQDLTAFNDYVAKAPVLVATASQQAAAGNPPPATAAQAGKLTDEELAVACQLGVSTEQYLKTKEGK